jgi:dGTPase
MVSRFLQQVGQESKAVCVFHATLGVHEISKGELTKKPTKDIADKSTGFSKLTRSSFRKQPKICMIPNKTGDDIGFERHPWLI